MVISLKTVCLSNIRGTRITKEALIAIVDSDLGGAVILTIVLILINTIVTLFNPFKQKLILFRYIASVLNTISLIFLLLNALVILPLVIFREKELGVLGIASVLLVPISIFFAFRQVRSLFTDTTSFKRQLHSLFRVNVNVFTRAMLFFIPVAVFALIEIYLVGSRYSPPSFAMIWKTVLVAPFVEEFSFRFMLPKLACNEDCMPSDYLLFSIFFLLLHGLNLNLFPFFFSLYLYLVISKTKNLAITILFHSFWNFCILAFPYIPLKL